jgi:hypothetical protein
MKLPKLATPVPCRGIAAVFDGELNAKLFEELAVP